LSRRPVGKFWGWGWFIATASTKVRRDGCCEAGVANCPKNAQFSVNAPADRLGRDHANAAVQVGLVLARFDEFERFGFAMPAPVPGFAGTDCIRLDFSEMLYHLNSPFELDRESSI
jgi:hypothetical protein